MHLGLTVLIPPPEPTVMVYGTEGQAWGPLTDHPHRKRAHRRRGTLWGKEREEKGEGRRMEEKASRKKEAVKKVQGYKGWYREKKEKEGKGKKKKKKRKERKREKQE